ncbi:hypothetical protein ACFL52_04140 [Candidatus Margulisiibacteriota bacterium]
MKKFILFLLLISVFFVSNVYAEDTQDKKWSIKVGYGQGNYNENAGPEVPTYAFSQNNKMYSTSYGVTVNYAVTEQLGMYAGLSRFDIFGGCLHWPAQTFYGMFPLAAGKATFTEEYVGIGVNYLVDQNLIPIDIALNAYSAYELFHLDMPADLVTIFQAFGMLPAGRSQWVGRKPVAGYGIELSKSFEIGSLVISPACSYSYGEETAWGTTTRGWGSPTVSLYASLPIINDLDFYVIASKGIDINGGTKSSYLSTQNARLGVILTP